MRTASTIFQAAFLDGQRTWRNSSQDSWIYLNGQVIKRTGALIGFLLAFLASFLANFAAFLASFASVLVVFVSFFGSGLCDSSCDSRESFALIRVIFATKLLSYKK